MPTRRLLLGGMAAALARPAQAAGPPDGDWVAFDDSEGLIRFQGQVNGHVTSLTLDSGAGRVTLDRAFARQIGLQVLDTKGALRGLSGSSPGGLSGPVVVDLGAGDLRLDNTVIADLSATKAAGVDVPVLLGRDIFELCSVDIDFVRKRLAFRQPGSFDTAGFRRVQLRPAKDIRQVEVSIEGRQPVWAMLDLGANSALQMSKDYASNMGLLEGRRRSTGMSAGIEGIDTYDVAWASQVAIAGITLPEVRFEAYPVWNRSATTQVNIGASLIRRLGRIILDYRSDSLFVGKQTPSPESRASSAHWSPGSHRDPTPAQN